MKQVERLWAQYYELSGNAVDACDIFISHIGRDAVISQAVYQKEPDGKWIASVRYWESVA
jgi:hypothetical protein